MRIAAVHRFTSSKFLGGKSEWQLIENRYSPFEPFAVLRRASVDDRSVAVAVGAGRTGNSASRPLCCDNWGGACILLSHLIVTDNDIYALRIAYDRYYFRGHQTFAHGAHNDSHSNPSR